MALTFLGIASVLAAILAYPMWPRLSRRRRGYLGAVYLGVFVMLFFGMKWGFIVWLTGYVLAWYYIEEPRPTPPAEPPA